MKNYFIIQNDRIELMYRGRIFMFDLNDGDREDYWNSCIYNGDELDINYYSVLDSLTIYNVHDETGQIDTSQFEPAYFLGDFTDKYVIVHTDNVYELKKYNDSKDIIIYDNQMDAYLAENSVGQFSVPISNLPVAELLKIFTQKIKEYEDKSRRSA